MKGRAHRAAGAVAGPLPLLFAGARTCFSAASSERQRRPASPPRTGEVLCCSPLRRHPRLGPRTGWLARMVERHWCVQILLHLAAISTRSIGPAPDDRQLRCALRRPLIQPLHRLRALDQSGGMLRLLLDWRLAGWTTARAVARVDSKPILHRKEAR